jgi:hypothetical protein
MQHKFYRINLESGEVKVIAATAEDFESSVESAKRQYPNCKIDLIC